MNYKFSFIYGILLIIHYVYFIHSVCQSVSNSLSVSCARIFNRFLLLTELLICPVFCHPCLCYSCKGGCVYRKRLTDAASRTIFKFIVFCPKYKEQHGKDIWNGKVRWMGAIHLFFFNDLCIKSLPTFSPEVNLSK